MTAFFFLNRYPVCDIVVLQNMRVPLWYYNKSFFLKKRHVKTAHSMEKPSQAAQSAPTGAAPFKMTADKLTDINGIIAAPLSIWLCTAKESNGKATAQIARIDSFLISTANNIPNAVKNRTPHTANRSICNRKLSVVIMLPLSHNIG